LFKDAVNTRNNQKNIGLINNSNLCAEIVEYSSPTETAVCNLASISLPKFYDQETDEFDFKKLDEICRIMITNLDRVIDRNHYPVKEARYSNMRHRPVGLGIQGLAKLFSKMGVAYDSKRARIVNRRIGEVMYFASISQSCLLAELYGAHSSIDDNGGSPIRNGIFQQDMFTFDQLHHRIKEVYPDMKTKPETEEEWCKVRDSVIYDQELKLDWEGLRANCIEHGVRNSLVRCDMPTASTSQILGNTECFEPYYGNIYSRKTKAGEFFLYNRYMVDMLKKRGLWKKTLDPVTFEEVNLLWNKIIDNNGSLQGLDEIPQDIQDIFKCTRDLKLKDLTLMAFDRALFIDQSMSLNIHFKNEDNLSIQIIKYLCFAHRLGLKTGSYYTRTLQEIKALNFKNRNDTDSTETPQTPVPRVLGMPVKKRKIKRVECNELVCTSCSG
jgi:ribonucleoside-diphosphate reductase subunit M1